VAEWCMASCLAAVLLLLLLLPDLVLPLLLGKE
jgi:hypothetical protein